MAEQSLSAGVTTKKRVFFGLLDADGWAWATVKAAFWFVVLVMMLGYLPDRAYYFTVFPTIALGLDPQLPPAQYVTPINFCPSGNGDMPCPVPTGAMLPWQPSPPEIALPAGRTDGALVQYGTKLLYIGGTDGTNVSKDVFVAELVGSSTFDKWQPGPALPEARSDASVLFSNGSIYVIGGKGPDGKPTTTTWALTPDSNGNLGDWKTLDALALPEARYGAAVVSAQDGLILVGGSNGTAPTSTVWKSSLDKNGALQKWTPNQEIVIADSTGATQPAPRVDAEAALVGDYLWVYGGSDASGPTAAVLRGTLTVPVVKSGSPPGTLPDPTYISQWATSGGTANLPGPRTDAAGFTANGAMYLVGGSDGTSTKGDVWWTTPSAQGEIDRWQSLSQTDLPAAGLAGAGAAVSGATAFLVGGESGGAVLASAVRADLSPAPPFFQLGLLGATVPALQIQGEIGQQLGYLNAAGVGTVDFILLLLVGYAFAHREKTRAFFERIRHRRR